MIFEEADIAAITQDPVNGILAVIDKAVATQNRQQFDEKKMDILYEAAALVSSALQGIKLPITAVPHPDLTSDVVHNFQALMGYLGSVRGQLTQHSIRFKSAALRERYAAALGTSFHYEFSQGDLDRVQQLINELRQQLADSKLFDEGHRRRLLSRLEKLQAELHKKVSDFDHYWGLFVDVGIALGKFGKEAKPFADLANELMKIVWGTQARRDELASSAPMPALLPPDPSATDDK